MFALITAAKEHEMLVAGNILAVVKKFMIGPDKLQQLRAALFHWMYLEDLCLIAFFGYAILPLAKLFYIVRRGKDNEEKFPESKSFRVAEIVSQLARIGGLVFAVDILSVTLKTLGFQFAVKHSLSQTTAIVAYSVWGALRLSRFKHHMLYRKVPITKRRQGRAAVYDRMLNALITILTGVLILDFLSIETGVALNSLFAFGSIWTLVFSLASKDLAAQFLSALALSATDKFHEGENILLGDGTSGNVLKVGWMHTDILCKCTFPSSPFGHLNLILTHYFAHSGAVGDELIVKIPNSQLADQRVSNISRTNKCQVKQELWFDYDDIDKLPQVIKDIKEEISRNCPHLIKDGSRPFRVHWRDYKDDHLEVVVDARFHLPPASDIYWDNREEVLKAIATAAKKNGVSFAFPTYSVRGGEDPSAVGKEMATHRYGVPT